MRTFDNYGERFDRQGTMILVTDHLAAMKEKDKDLGILNNFNNRQANELSGLTRDLLETKEEIARMKEHTWCAYCGFEIHIDDEASTKISEHIMTCPKHPIRVAFEEIERLRELVRKSEGMANEINILTEENNTLIAEIERLKAELAPSAYWQRMVEEGYWDNNEHKWTDKGWKEIVK